MLTHIFRPVHVGFDGEREELTIDLGMGSQLRHHAEGVEVDHFAAVRRAAGRDGQNRNTQLLGNRVRDLDRRQLDGHGHHAVLLILITHLEHFHCALSCLTQTLIAALTAGLPAGQRANVAEHDQIVVRHILERLVRDTHGQQGVRTAVHVQSAVGDGRFLGSVGRGLHVEVDVDDLRRVADALDPVRCELDLHFGIGAIAGNGQAADIDIGHFSGHGPELITRTRAHLNDGRALILELLQVVDRLTTLLHS